LKLLANLLFDMSVLGIDLAKPAFKRIDIIKRELVFSNQFYAFHDLDKPASRLDALIAKKECSLPLRKHIFFWLELTITNEEDFSGCGDLIQKNVAADPAGASRSISQRFPLFYDLANKEMLGNNKEIGDSELS
jgi:hypothetical protein